MIYLVRAPEYIGRPEKNIADWIIEDWKKASYQFTEIKGVAPKEMGQGVFYDTEDSIRNYIEKYIRLHDMVKDGDSILFVEGWNVSIPLFKLYLDSMNRKVKLYGIFHSAIDVPGEYLTQFPWARPFEQVLGRSFEKIFVATKYIRNKISLDNVVVTGLPLPLDIVDRAMLEEERFKEKKKIVVFSHRWYSDKRPDVFAELANTFKDEAEFWLLTPKEIQINEPNIKVVVNRTREEYLANLAQASIIFSSAELETFGYSVLEGVFSYCNPLLIRSACYPEMYDDYYLYSNNKEMFEKFKVLLNEPFDKDRVFTRLFSWFGISSIRIHDEIVR